jgi:hypothetical protein
MFFIGGFNSIIPYLLYLSLIWVFMIIGFGGKINQVLHKLAPKEHHAGHEILPVSVVGNYELTHHEVVQIQELPDGSAGRNGYTICAVACITAIAPVIFPGFIPPDRYTPFLRGPPAILS